jgi:hypothetical protein
MQLHPHFLFNTLHMISELVHEDPDTADRMIASLSELLRETLGAGDVQEVPLRREIALLERYLDIQQARFGDRRRRLDRDGRQLHGAPRGPATHLVRDTMNGLAEELDAEKFVRIHRSTIVQIDRIRELLPAFHGDFVVVLHDGTRLTMSRGYRQQVEALLRRPL